MGQITDIDGNSYITVVIGKQEWMAENLNVSKYRNGDPIPEVKDLKEWNKLRTGAWCYYNNDPEKGEIYDKLYNWYAVNDPRGLAPEGWHIPSVEEWSELLCFLGGKSVAGDKLKEAGNTHWLNNTKTATNKSGFTALPGGIRFPDGRFWGGRTHGHWWSSTESESDGARASYMIDGTIDVNFGNYYKAEGYSIRCVRD